MRAKRSWGYRLAAQSAINHPLEKWTNDQYYAMANMFARVRAKGWGGDARSGAASRTIVVLDRGDLIQPSRGKHSLPHLSTRIRSILMTQAIDESCWPIG